MKKALILTWVISLFVAMGYIFWRVEYVNNLPTPLPARYTPVSTGQQLQLPFYFSNNKPVFIHFFNPDCPCSRFNIDHFKDLLAQYGQEVNFVMVVMSEEKGYDAKKIKKKYGIDLPVYTDSALAAATGVYSTPQAVILTPDKKLFYRGNYNRSRYCTDQASNYAQQSLESLLYGKPAGLDQFATQAYGCTLPKRKIL